MPEPNQLQPYGQAQEVPPPEVEPQLESGYIPSAVIWAYVAIVGTFLCSPIGLVAGIYALTRRPNTPRARMLATTSVVFSGLAILVGASYIALAMLGAVG